MPFSSRITSARVRTRSARAPGHVASVQLFDRHCNALPYPDAHGCERPFATALFHAVDRGHRQSRAAHAERMTERDGAAMRIDEIGVLPDAELPQARDPLAGEGFVEFDQIEIAYFQPQP